MHTPEVIAEGFRQVDFHDDTLFDIRVVPAQCRGEDGNSVVEIHLHQPSGKNPRAIRFSGCTNLRVAMDFDVLAGNYPPNTSRGEAHTDSTRILSLIQSQEDYWDVKYAGTPCSPLAKKLATLDELVSFRVQFFGGVVDVIAREYQVEASNTR